jgi:hypothetical protein
MERVVVSARVVGRVGEAPDYARRAIEIVSGLGDRLIAGASLGAVG